MTKQQLANGKAQRLCCAGSAVTWRAKLIKARNPQSLPPKRLEVASFCVSFGGHACRFSERETPNIHSQVHHAEPLPLRRTRCGTHRRTPVLARAFWRHVRVFGESFSVPVQEPKAVKVPFVQLVLRGCACVSVLPEARRAQRQEPESLRVGKILLEPRKVSHQILYNAVWLCFFPGNWLAPFLFLQVKASCQVCVWECGNFVGRIL